MNPTKRNPLALYALTKGGVDLVRRLASALLPSDYAYVQACAQPHMQTHIQPHIFVPERWHQDGERSFSSLSAALEKSFQQYDAHIFVCATGIVVRSIAPYLVHKSTDPAVVVCDELGHFAVSLLSGHWGGGNALAQRVAQVTNGQAVITTATDVQGLAAVDVLAQESGCTILDWDKVKCVNAALLRGETVQVYDPARVLQWQKSTISLIQYVDVPPIACTPSFLQPEVPSFSSHAPKKHQDITSFCSSASLAHQGDADILHATSVTHQDNTGILHATPTVIVDWHKHPPAEQVLRVCVPLLHVGVGCRKNVAAAEILQAIYATLELAGLAVEAVAALASVDAKQGEQGLHEAAHTLRVPVHFFSPEALAGVAVPTPSVRAAQMFAVENISVCEGAALLAAEDSVSFSATKVGPFLCVPKRKHGRCITVAVASRFRCKCLL